MQSIWVSDSQTYKMGWIISFDHRIQDNEKICTECYTIVFKNMNRKDGIQTGNKEQNIAGVYEASVQGNKLQEFMSYFCV